MPDLDPNAAPGSRRVPAQATRQTPAALLAAHVPLSLLLDIADPTGPHSRDLLAEEPGCADWLRPSPEAGPAT